MLDCPDREMIIRTLLADLGYMDWLMVCSRDPGPEAIEVTFYLENLKSKRRAAFAIPKALFPDPRLYPSIKKLISLALLEPDGVKNEHLEPNREAQKIISRRQAYNRDAFNFFGRCSGRNYFRHFDGARESRVYGFHAFTSYRVWHGACQEYAA